MSTLPRIHGRIAAKPRHSCATEVLNVRYALVCRDMQRRDNAAPFYALTVLAAIAGAAIAGLVI